MPWEELKKDKPTLWSKYGSPVWNALTYSPLPTTDRSNSWERIYEDVLRPFATPLGVIGAKTAAPRATKYIKKGITNPSYAPSTYVPPNPAIQALGGRVPAQLTGLTTPIVNAARTTGDVLSTLRDEAKQIAMTFGLPGTGVSSHGIALATAHLKGTPVKKFPKEAYETARMLWNPERAVELNKKLTGGVSLTAKKQEIIDGLKNQFPGADFNSPAFKGLVEAELDRFAVFDPTARASRFKDVLDLERSKKWGGGGLLTSDILGGTSKGSIPSRQILTKPIIVGKTSKYNINPLSIQKELFDTPLFGQDYINTYLKRKSALDELDRLRKAQPFHQLYPAGRQIQLGQAADFATTTLGGFGSESGGMFNKAGAKWLLTAPDWTRRHFALANKELQSIGLDIPRAFKGENPIRPRNLKDPRLAPYRRYLGYSAGGLGLTGGINYALNGQMPTRATDFFNIELPPNSDYSTRDVVTPFSTEMDIPKTAVDVANALAPESLQFRPETKDFDAIAQFWRYRLHPMSRAIAELGFNMDWRGNRMMGEKTFTEPERDLLGNVRWARPDIPKSEALYNILTNTLGNVTPQAADAISEIYRGELKRGKRRLSPAAILGQIFELPIRGYTPRYTQVETPLDRKLKRSERKLKRLFK